MRLLQLSRPWTSTKVGFSFDVGLVVGFSCSRVRVSHYGCGFGWKPNAAQLRSAGCGCMKAMDLNEGGGSGVLVLGNVDVC